MPEIRIMAASRERGLDVDDDALSIREYDSDGVPSDDENSVDSRYNQMNPSRRIHCFFPFDLYMSTSWF